MKDQTMRQFDWKRLESTQLLCLLSDRNILRSIVLIVGFIRYNIYQTCKRMANGAYVRKCKHYIILIVKVK